MVKLTTIIFILLSLIIANPAMSKSTKAAEAQYAVKGAGLASCEKFSAAHKQRSSDYFLYAGWLEGYLSGFNQNQAATYDIAPWQTLELMLGMLNAHCLKKPDDPYFTAVNRLLSVMFPHRLESNDKLLKIKQGTKGQIIYQQTLVKVQAKLKEAGLYFQEPNGEYDQTSVDALINFQKSKKIPVTGMPDVNTLYALLMAPK